MIHNLIYLGTKHNPYKNESFHKFQLDKYFIEIYENNNTLFDKFGTKEFTGYIDLKHPTFKLQYIPFYKKLNLILNNLDLLCK